MARVYTVRVTLIDGSEWFVPIEELTSGGITETPESVIGGFMRGTRGSTLKVNTLANMTGDKELINPSFIIRAKVTFVDE